MRSIRCVVILVVFACYTSAFGQSKTNSTTQPAGSSQPGVPWPVTDALGRVAPLAEEVGPPKPDRFAGIFYFLWLNERHNKCPQHEGPYDVSRILAADPDALKKPDSPLWGPIGRSHYWGEPLYGYYLITDPWVIRRHAYLLADAGIDTLIFDATNAITYREQYTRLCEVFRQVRAEGGRTPAIAFMVNTEAGKTAKELYRDLYKRGLFKELWFIWQGKPLLICDPAQATDELKAFFTLRRAHWPFEQKNTPYAWHWEAAYPQVYGYTDDPNRPEQVNVSVAQNLRGADGAVTNMSNGDARGRSFHMGKLDTTAGAVDRGYNAAEQWERALKLDPPFVMVTGWNEWIAGRWGQPGGPIVFVDQFSQECSRDIEPMKGGHADNYYAQLVANVRRYKGAAPLPVASGPKSIHIDAGFEQWRNVQPEFRDHVGETLPRDFEGAGGLRYTNHTGRNDIESCKVARDATNVYFYVRTREPLSPPSDPNWMWLLLDTDRNKATGWEGYDFVVNRVAPTGQAAVLEKNVKGWAWQRQADVRLRISGREMHLAIPRGELGQPLGSTGLTLDFKWTDNVQVPGEIMEFYLNGDTAPEGRFSFRFSAE